MKALKILSLVLLVFAFCVRASASPKVLIVLNEGYRPEEYFEPRKAFDAAGFEVKVAGHYAGQILPSHPHWNEVPPVPTDLTFTQASVADFDAVVFVGGTGAWSDFLPNPDVHHLLNESFAEGKVTALICAATGLLAMANNLDGDHPQFAGKHVTGYFEVAGLIKKVGLLNYDPGIAGQPYVVTDGKLITGRDPISARLFAQTIVTVLTNQQKEGSPK